MLLTEPPLLVLGWLRTAQTYGHVMGWIEPSVFLKDNSTLAFTRQMAQLKVNNSEFLVFGRLMRPAVLTMAGGAPLPTTSWCQAAWKGKTCCETALVIGQVWMADDGTGSVQYTTTTCQIQTGWSPHSARSFER